MHSFLPKCDPEDHCYHEGQPVPATDPPQVVMVCCTCGHTYKGKAANLHQIQKLPKFRPH